MFFRAFSAEKLINKLHPYPEVHLPHQNKKCAIKRDRHYCEYLMTVWRLAQCCFWSEYVSWGISVKNELICVNTLYCISTVLSSFQFNDRSIHIWERERLTVIFVHCIFNYKWVRLWERESQRERERKEGKENKGQMPRNQ